MILRSFAFMSNSYKDFSDNTCFTSLIFGHHNAISPNAGEVVILHHGQNKHAVSSLQQEFHDYERHRFGRNPIAKLLCSVLKLQSLRVISLH
jgi:hypothetical protein